MTTPIPSPPGLPIIGNLLDIQDEVPIRALENLADVYGPIYKLRFGGQERIFISNRELLEEICDEKRFCKSLPQGLQGLGNGGATGLFTAPHESDPDWGQAHRTLMPAFGPLAIRELFDEMHDIGSQLVMKWARKGDKYKIPVTSDFTRLTLDTIALCAMDYRFNSFYQNEMHPFVEAMNKTLQARSDSRKPLNMISSMVFGPSQKPDTNRLFMSETSMQLVQQRRNRPVEKKDLLNAMLLGKDPKTGELMRDELIVANMSTFLIAGHETTSGLLSFAFFELLKNPDTFFKAQQEVDRVVGQGKLTVDHLKELKYLNAVLRETLRLNPTVPAIARAIRPESEENLATISNGKHTLWKGTQVVALIGKAQRDPTVYGDDANEFKPERMYDEHFDKLPSAAWKPFGTGVRACIGRAFAWQESLLVSALILQNLHLRMDDSSYELQIKQALTVKPKDFYMRATVREGRSATSLLNSAGVADPLSQPTQARDGPNDANAGSQNPKEMTILYGSNAGTCQSLAQSLSSSAARCGFRAKVLEMDTAVQKVPKSQPVVIITPSYDGEPTNNAKHFLSWLESLVDTDKKPFEGVEYAVFGCGHSDWSATYQRIPKLVDRLIAEHGGHRIMDRGIADAAKGDVFGDFDGWADGQLLSKIAPSAASELKASHASGSSADIEISTQGRASHLNQDVRPANVLSASRLTAGGEPEKRHLEVRLPLDTSYECGDYLAVLPLNPDASVQRVFKRYGVPWDAVITIKGGGPAMLPENTPLSAYEIFKGYVELSLPATKKDIRSCISFSREQKATTQLENLLTEDHFQEEIIAKRTTLLDLLCRHPCISLPLGDFLTMLPPMRPRHYSISSSPLHNPETCTITYGIINEKAYSGQGQFIGVAGSYLRSLKPGDTIQVSVRSTNKLFRLPIPTTSNTGSDNTGTPIIMFAAGTGLAPFRGFLQERAAKLQAARDNAVTLPPALLFVGCRSASKDRLYADDIDEWVKQGAAEVRYAFSRDPENPLASGCRYVQDRMLKDKEDIVRLWEQGAKVFVCGSPGLVESVGKAARDIVKERAVEMGLGGVGDEEVEKWFSERRNVRFVADVFR